MGKATFRVFSLPSGSNPGNLAPVKYLTSIFAVIILAAIGLACWEQFASPSVNLTRATQYRDWVNHGLDAYEAASAGKADPTLKGKDFTGVIAFLMRGNFIPESEAQQILAFNRHASAGDQLYLVHDGPSMFHVTSLSLETREQRMSLSS